MESAASTFMRAGKTASRLRSGITGVALASLAAASAAAQQVELTMWSWLPDLQLEIDLFEAANPHIAVNLINAGAGEAQYLELRNAIRAGRGAPDVVHIAFEMQPTFQLSGALLDLGPLGADALAEDFVDWSWAQVSGPDGGVYGMPWDSGPIGIVYRGDLFDQHGIAPPATWEEFREGARQLREAAPDSYITTAAFNDGGWANALFWQGGSRPFDVIDEDSIRISINSEAAKRVADYWTELIAEDLVDTQPIFTPEWYTSLDRGRVASWITAGWGRVFLSQFTAESLGQWRAMPIPQWDPAAPASANWGGSTIAVMASTEHPEEAARLAIFLAHDPEAAQMFIDTQYLFPVLREKLGSDAFLAASTDFYGGQPFNGVFAESSELIDTDFEWSPFQDFVAAQMGIELGTAAAEGRSLSEALDRVQEVVVDYAEEQGFEVVD